MDSLAPGGAMWSVGKYIGLQGKIISAHLLNRLASCLSVAAGALRAVSNMMARLVGRRGSKEISEGTNCQIDDSRMVYRAGKKTLIGVVKPGFALYGRG